MAPLFIILVICLLILLIDCFKNKRNDGKNEHEGYYDGFQRSSSR